jgi:hypothetical protein
MAAGVWIIVLLVLLGFKIGMEEMEIDEQGS